MKKSYRITCQQSPHGVVRPNGDCFFANVWSVARISFGGPAQLGHGEGKTRAEAIRNAKLNAGVL